MTLIALHIALFAALLAIDIPTAAEMWKTHARTRTSKYLLEVLHLANQPKGSVEGQEVYLSWVELEGGQGYFDYYVEGLSNSYRINPVSETIYANEAPLYLTQADKAILLDVVDVCQSRMLNNDMYSV